MPGSRVTAAIASTFLLFMLAWAPARADRLEVGAVLEQRLAAHLEVDARPQVRNLRVAASRVVRDETVETYPRARIARQTFISVNCAETPREIGGEAEISYLAGHVLSFDPVLTLDTAGRVEIDLPLRDEAATGAEVPGPLRLIINKSRVLNALRSRRDTVTAAQTLAPMTALLVTAEKQAAIVRRHFALELTVDGDLDLMRPGRDAAEPSGSLASRLPSDQRTFVITGEVWTVTGGKTVPRARTVDLTPEDCADAPQEPLTPLGVGALPAAGAPREAILSLEQGRPITTGPVTANVAVRALSQGEGFCLVRVTGGGGQADILAPPLALSGWTTLFTHTGAVTNQISVEKHCDIGAFVQIRYRRGS